MHDAKNRPLKVGDFVLILARITELHPTEEYCNVSVETVFGRRPDWQKERLSAINTAVLLRAQLSVYEDMLSDAPVTVTKAD